MPRDYELDRIKAQEQVAFQRKQSAWASYKSAKDRADDAYDEMQSAWNERVRARDEMNREFEQMQAERAAHDDVWDEYGRIRDSNNARIDYLRQEADSEHQAMQRCFEQASQEYEYGDKAMASVYSQEGHGHKDRRDELNYEISALCNEVKEAKQNAQWRTQGGRNGGFRYAKDAFESAKARHETAQSNFKYLKAERDRLKKEFEYAKEEHERLKAEFQSRLETVKREREAEKSAAMRKVEVALLKKPAYCGSIFGKDAKVVPRNDGSGKTDVYYGGLEAAGDGIGHGHAVIDRNGNVTYLRDAWQDHKDYIIDDRKDNPYNN